MSNQVEVICLDSDDEVPNTNKENILNHTAALKNEGGGVKSEQPGTIFSQSTNDDDEVEVVDGSDLQPELSTNATATAAAGSDDELEIVGTKNEANYIHNRQNCLVCRYKLCSDVKQWHAENRLFCSKCYCFICDKPAVECEDWFEGERGVCVDDDEGGDSGDDAKPAAEENDVASEDKSVESQQVSETLLSEPCTKSPDGIVENPDDAAISLGTEKESSSMLSNAEANESLADSTNNSKPAAIDSLATEQALSQSSQDDAKTPKEATNETEKPTSAAAAAVAVADPDKHKPHKNHCQATDDGPLKSFWRSMRSSIKEGHDPSKVSSDSTARTNVNSEHELQLAADRYAFDLESAMQQAIGMAATARSTGSRRRGRSNPPTSNRRRTRPRNSSLGPSDHRQRIRAQNMLEALYQNPDGWS